MGCRGWAVVQHRINSPHTRTVCVNIMRIVVGMRGCWGVVGGPNWRGLGSLLGLLFRWGGCGKGGGGGGGVRVRDWVEVEVETHLNQVPVINVVGGGGVGSVGVCR